MLGQILSHYKIVEKLGGGGMGVVYRAEDERLRRAVAIKVLPPDLTRDREAKARFVLEAQSASALDHPNICTIFEVDETSEGQMFLVMAYYPGETLKRKIERGPLKLDDALDYAIQIAQALKKAHESGIVHRDIKPANVLVTGDALVKVVDFGLAKLVSQSGLTRTGTVLGTVSYMSPEQGVGHVADARTDLWALGVVLHEMIAGQQPFRGDSDMAVASAIAHTAPPPLTSLRSGLPLDLDRVVSRALSKSPDDRYQTAADFLSELRRLRRESGGHSDISRVVAGAGAGPIPAAASARRGRAWLLVAGLAIAAAGAIYFISTRREPVAATSLLSNPVKVAATITVENNPSWSPDGSMIAYDARDGVGGDVWVMQLGGGPPINRTADFGGPDYYPRFSPDGRQIAFASLREGGGIFVMSALAGSARKIGPMLPGVLSPAVWNPDPASSEIAYAVPDGNTILLERQNLKDGRTSRLELPGRKGNTRIDLAWSPDGKFIAYVDARNYTAQVTKLWILRLSDSKAVPLTDGLMNDWSPTWAPDSRTVYFTSNRGAAMDIWRQRIGDDGSPSGEAERLTTGLEAATIALSPKGERIAYGKGRWLANAWRVPIRADRQPTWPEAQQLTFDQAHVEYLDVSHDGTRLAVTSDRSGNPDIWLMPAGGGELRQFTNDPTPDWNAAWSFDSRQIVFYAYRTGNRELWFQPVDGGPAQQLTSGDTESVFPRWSPTGKEIVYNSRIGGSADLWITSVPRGAARPLVAGPSTEVYADWSPDGNWIAYQSNRLDPARSQIWIVPAKGGESIPMSQGQGLRPRWSKDGQWIYFLRLSIDTSPGDMSAGITDVWRVSFDRKTEQRMTNVGTSRFGRLETNAISVDAKFIYFSWREDVGDIWVMDVKK